MPPITYMAAETLLEEFVEGQFECITKAGGEALCELPLAVQCLDRC